MRITTTLVAGWVVLAGTATFAQQASAPPIAVRPGPAITGKADAPAPAADATKTRTAGKGKTTARTANGPDDGDSAWVETIDIDGDGDPEVTDLVWDDEDKMLFLHAGDLFACKNGGAGEGDGSTARAIRVGAPLARDSSS